MKYIDFHTHIFPDRIAKQALEYLSEDSGDYHPQTDGTLAGLLRSMDEASISKSVVANISTKPSQTAPILEFSLQIKSDRIIPLVSFHPGNTMQEVDRLLRQSVTQGIPGVKLHPMYQEFTIDDHAMFPFYEMIRDKGLFLVFHSGYDIAFPGNTQADVERVARVAGEFGDLVIVTTHVGGWRQWDRINVLTEKKNIYTEISMTLSEIDEGLFVKTLMLFDEDRILFGTDSPWTDQKDMVKKTEALPISDAVKAKLFYENAERLLASSV